MPKTKSMETTQQEMLQGARATFENPSLRMKDIKEWKVTEIDPEDGEVVSWVSEPGVYVAILEEDDNR